MFLPIGRWCSCCFKAQSHSVLCSAEIQLFSDLFSWCAPTHSAVLCWWMDQLHQHLIWVIRDNRSLSSSLYCLTARLCLSSVSSLLVCSLSSLHTVFIQTNAHFTCSHLDSVFVLSDYKMSIKQWFSHSSYVHQQSFPNCCCCEWNQHKYKLTSEWSDVQHVNI